MSLSCIRFNSPRYQEGHGKPQHRESPPVEGWCLGDVVGQQAVAQQVSNGSVHAIYLTKSPRDDGCAYWIWWDTFGEWKCWGGGGISEVWRRWGWVSSRGICAKKASAYYPLHPKWRIGPPGPICSLLAMSLSCIRFNSPRYQEGHGKPQHRESPPVEGWCLGDVVGQQAVAQQVSNGSVHAIYLTKSPRDDGCAYWIWWDTFGEWKCWGGGGISEVWRRWGWVSSRGICAKKASAYYPLHPKWRIGPPGPICSLLAAWCSSWLLQAIHVFPSIPEADVNSNCIL